MKYLASFIIVRCLIINALLGDLDYFFHMLAHFYFYPGDWSFQSMVTYYVFKKFV